MTTIHQIYETYDEAANVVRELEANGFTSDEITIVGKRGGEDEQSGASVGAATGLALGGGAGLLAGLGMLAVPGLGPLVAAGWMVPTLAGGVAGAVAGGIVGSLVDSGIEEEDAHVYAETLKRGGALVIVRTTPERAPAARAIFDRVSHIDTADRRRRYQAEGWNRFGDGAV